MEDQLTKQWAERYYYRQMPPDERADLESRMATDQELALTIAAYEALFQERDRRLQEKLVADARAGLRHTSSGAVQGGQPAFHISYLARRLAAALVLVLLAALGFWGYRNYLRTQSPEQAAYSKYYKPLKKSGLLSAGSNAGETSRWDNAFSLYENKQYTDAFDAAAALLQSESFGNKALLLRGVCMLEQNRTEEAVAQFQQIQPAALSVYREGLWFTALARLRSGNREQAAAALRRISEDPENPRRQDAAEILNTLK